MKRFLSVLALSGLPVLGAVFFVTSAAAAAPSVQFNGNTYYMVNGNDPKMDTGTEVCASMKMQCLGYKSVNTNSICKLFHPTAKELVSVNGSKAGFYCNGSPQQGLACAKMMNTCQVCPNCNLNEAEKCDAPIGQHFREMYVWCGNGSSSSVKSSSKAGAYGPLPLSSSKSNMMNDPNNCGAVGKKCPTGTVCNNGACMRSSSSSAPLDPRIGQRPGYKVCEYYQATKAGDMVKATKKLVSCGVPGLADGYCRTALNNPAAKSLKCEENGIVICGLPCTTPGARNEWFCSADINRPRGTMVKPLDFCPPMASSAPAAAKNPPGALCKHGGECTTGNCIGIGPDFGKEYRCSCNAFRYEVGCSGSSSSRTTKGVAGQTCVHGGDCLSGMCLGVVPGQRYVCSCLDPVTRWDGCRK